MRAGNARRGFSLLDPLAAVTLLGIAGTAFVMLLGQVRSTMESVHRVELRTRAASALLAGLSREPRPVLEGKVGRRLEGEFELRISLWPNDLFEIEVMERATGRPMVSTFVYRPPGIEHAR